MANADTLSGNVYSGIKKGLYPLLHMLRHKALQSSLLRVYGWGLWFGVTSSPLKSIVGGAIHFTQTNVYMSTAASSSFVYNHRCKYSSNFKDRLVLARLKSTIIFLVVLNETLIPASGVHFKTVWAHAFWYPQQEREEENGMCSAECVVIPVL